MNSGLYALLGGASATAIAAACANRFDGPGTNASNVYAGNGRPGAPIARCAGVGGNTARGLGSASGVVTGAGASYSVRSRPPRRSSSISRRTVSGWPAASDAASRISSMWLRARRSRTYSDGVNSSRTSPSRAEGRTSANHIAIVLSGRAALARSMTCDQVCCASCSDDAMAIPIHRPFPQRWKTFGEVRPSRSRNAAAAAGRKPGRIVAPRFSPPHPAPGVLTLFLLSRPLSCADGGSYTGARAGPGPASLSKGPSDVQAYVPAQHPPSREDARLPPPHEDPRRPRDPVQPALQGSNAPVRLGRAPAARARRARSGQTACTEDG